MPFTTKVVLGFVESKRPVSGQKIGTRLVASFPNTAAYDVFSGKYIQSHAPKYRLTESGDYPTDPTVEQVGQWKGWVAKTYKVRF